MISAIHSWNSWILAASWQLALVILVVGVLTLCLRRMSARVRYGLWMLVLVKAFVPPGLAVPWSVGNIAAQLPTSLRSSRPGPITSGAERPAAQLATGSTAVKAEDTAFSESVSSPSLLGTGLRPRSSSLWFYMWLAGVAVYGVAVAVPYIRLNRRLRAAEHLDEGPLAITLHQQSIRLGASTVPRLVVSSQISSPFIHGLVYPCIVLPGSILEELTPQQVEQVLLHELIHWKRCDVAVGWIQVLVQALFWFHPLVWFANAQLREERERVCDELIVSGGHAAPRPYAESLLQAMLAVRGHSIASAASPGIFERNTRLQQRLEDIMKQELKPRRFGFAGWCIIATCAFALMPMAGVSTANAELSQASTGSAAAKNLDPKLLNELQQAYVKWTEMQFGGEPDPSRYSSNTQQEKDEMEKRWLTVVEGPEGAEFYGAITGLAALRSQKAIQPLLRIASEQRDKNNRGRWMAVRALGLLGDTTVVPSLIHLVYHPNQNTRMWAQISLVRLTGKNFAYDWESWASWWNSLGSKPAFSTEKIQWIKDPKDMIYADTAKQKEIDAEFLQKFKERLAAPAKKSPPRVINTSPETGSTDVDPMTTAITVTFDSDMGKGMSWTGGGPDFPQSPEGAKAYWADSRTCVFPVSLKSASYYRVGINSTSYQNFKGADETPAFPTAIFFTTAGAGDDLKARVLAPKVVAMVPSNGATNVDPVATREISVTFNMPMGGGFSWTGSGPNYPQGAPGARPTWSADKMTCKMPVDLKSNWQYELGLNSPWHKNFVSEAGVPLEPVSVRFHTR